MNEKAKEIMKKHALSIKKVSKEELKKKRLKRLKTMNPNNFSMWYPEIKKLGFDFPRTQIIKIEDEWAIWLGSDNYTEEKIKDFNKYILSELERWALENLENGKSLFIKTGTFSGKFNFSDCKVSEKNKIGESFLNIFYNSMLVGAGMNNELIVREFLDEDEEVDTIYNGMPLRPEIRIFYDFDNQILLDWFNYFDQEEMVKKEKSFEKEDFRILSNNFKRLNEANSKLFSRIEEKIIKELKKNTSLKGVWSIDFMEVDGKAYLIDMAIGRKSYYFNKIEGGKNE